MARSGRGRSLQPVRQQQPDKPSRPSSRRDRIAILLGLVTYVCLGLAFLFSNGTQFLMPGTLASAHGAIENCGSCHTKSGSGKLSWMHGLVAGDPLDDSKACVTCHKMPETAFSPHGASIGVLRQSTERLAKVAAETMAPPSAFVQRIAFPTDGIMAAGVACASCHQEHKGANFDLKKVANEQCRGCHSVKFDSFDGSHPAFDIYPFKRRTRIVYDHMAHFSNHFPEAGQKDAAKRIPATCSTCHSSQDNKRVMAVAPFEQTCATCHLDQVTGKERASGPKGIAFLSLPSLDVDTLKEKKADIGEWPETEAEITPFMKVLLAQNDDGRAMIRRIERLNLQDLSEASDQDIAAVTKFVWRVKRLFYSLVTKRASDVLAELDLGGNVKVGKDLIVNLTASIPREVIVSAQREWLPNLGKEMANRKDDTPRKGAAGKPGQQRANFSESKLAASVALEELSGPVPNTVAREAGIRVAQAPRAADQTDDLLDPSGAAPAPAAAPAGRAAKPAIEPAAPAARAAAPAAEPAAPAAEPAAPAGKAPVRVAQSRAADQTDDLLFPNGGAPAAGAPAGGAPKPAAEPAEPAAPAAKPAPAAEPAEADAAPAAPAGTPAAAIESDVDDENWADFGGWYRQDFAILYRPGGHKDKFIYAWLSLTGLQSPKGLKSPAATVFDALTAKDAQGSCVKCHSVDDVPGKGRRVNFSPATAKTKEARFTTFIHEPHFGIMEARGCLTCHNLGKGGQYLKSYEQGNPQVFTSNFTPARKELCQTCHTSNMANQDCTTCHQYHINGVETPVMTTKIPTQ